jgi:hypothetical protein
VYGQQSNVDATAPQRPTFTFWHRFQQFFDVRELDDAEPDGELVVDAPCFTARPPFVHRLSALELLDVASDGPLSLLVERRTFSAGSLGGETNEGLAHCGPSGEFAHHFVSAKYLTAASEHPLEGGRRRDGGCFFRTPDREIS